MTFYRPVFALTALPLFLALFFLAGLTSFTAKAQDSSAASQNHNAQHSDATLKAFIISATKIRDIQRQWLPKIQKTQDQSKMNQIKKQVQGEMVSAIQGTNNISVDEFQKISQQFRTDKTLASRIQNIAKDMGQ